MFDFDKKTLLMIGVFVLVVAAIPFTAVMVKQTQVFKSSASEIKVATSSANLVGKIKDDKPQAIPSESPLSELSKLIQAVPSVFPTQSPSINSPTSNPADTELTPTPYVNLAFGPTLNISITIQGRPSTKQAARAFIGLASNTPTKNPTYLLTFTVDFPEDGIFKGLSLAGLNPGSTYSVYVKGPGQIDSASSFVMSPTESTVNADQPLLLLSGDLNDDNTINAADYTIAKNLYGTTPTSNNWNLNADFNRDNIINTYDLAYIKTNMGKTGVSSTWISTPSVATGSGSPSGGYDSPNVSSNRSGGYWLRIP